jgi:hypothetical protein
MATTNPETRLTKKLLDRLHAIPFAHVVKNHSDPYSKAGEPDLHGCIDGRFVALEVKVPGRTARPTPLQRVALDAWRAAGAHVAVVTSVDELDALLWNWFGIGTVTDTTATLLRAVDARLT